MFSVLKNAYESIESEISESMPAKKGNPDGRDNEIVEERSSPDEITPEVYVKELSAVIQ